MSFIAWLVLGLIAGYIGSKIVNHEGEGIIGHITVGIIGAFLGGLLFNSFGSSGVTGLNLWSLLVATSGAVALLIVYQFARRAPRIRSRHAGPISARRGRSR
jgi:uncharacterized membrane protein YeaQ/YmgE (transglycosylase-associated protein family)